MLIAIRGHYDGKVIVPNEPVDLPRGEELLFHVENPRTSKIPGVAGSSLLRFSGALAGDDLDQMTQAIDEGCEQVNTNEW